MAKRRILVVEDNADFQELLAMSASAWGHEVETASDGSEGLARILRGELELALVDIGLPVLDGYEVARRVRADARGQHIALVALTGYGSRDQRDLALESGFDCVLVKPVEPTVLQRVLACETRAQLREL
ncbi:MAG TPA: response regulator [Polyangiales bacterium]|nr:response regulator [Polyangiales bacterium]